MKRILSLVTALALLCTLIVQPVVFAEGETTTQNIEEKIYKLWYNEPAEQTNSGFESQSLPLGNGYMGVNVFGGTGTELISVTENSLVNPQGSGSSVGPDGDKRPSSNMGGLNILAKTYIDFGHTDVTDYTRDLVLNDAIAHVEYKYNDVIYSREYFTTYPDKVMAIRLSASEGASLNFTLRPIVPFERDYLTTEGDGKGKTGLVVAENDTITLSGRMNYYQTNFEAQYKIIPSGENAAMVASNDENGDNGTITVSNADSAVILLAVGTNYNMTSEVFTAARTEKLNPDEYPHEKVTGYINAAAAKSYETLKEEHLKDYQKYFDRVDLDLGGELSDSVTTDELLANYKTDSANNLYLEELIFQYGRYLLIASSREGCLPANLQGIWNFYIRHRN